MHVLPRKAAPGGNIDEGCRTTSTSAPASLRLPTGAQPVWGGGNNHQKDNGAVDLPANNGDNDNYHGLHANRSSFVHRVPPSQMRGLEFDSAASTRQRKNEKAEGRLRWLYRGPLYVVGSIRDE